MKPGPVLSKALSGNAREIRKLYFHIEQIPGCSLQKKHGESGHCRQNILSADQPDERLRKLRTGFVAVLGQTNVGKSTFLNVVMGQKLLITSKKPQTTRNRIRCVLTTHEAQIVFVDTPGLHKPGDQLSRRILREARRGLRGMDVLIYVVEPWGKIPELDRYPFKEHGPA